MFKKHHLLHSRKLLNADHQQSVGQFMRTFDCLAKLNRTEPCNVDLNGYLSDVDSYQQKLVLELKQKYYSCAEGIFIYHCLSDRIKNNFVAK